MICFQSCLDDDECGACFTPPAPFIFEIVNKATGENLFNNGTYNSSDIKIVNLADDSIVEHNFIDENNFDLIQINKIGWQTEIINYSLKIGVENIFNLYVDAKRLNENCCSFTRYNEIRIENSEYEFNTNTGIYKILVE